MERKNTQQQNPWNTLKAEQNLYSTWIPLKLERPQYRYTS